MEECKKVVSTAQISYDIRLTQEDVDDIMVSALEGGINYWCRRAEVVGEYLGEWASEQISRGGALLIHIIDENEPKELDLAKFTKGVKLLVENGYDRYRAFKKSDVGPNDICQVDAVIADMIIQFALFGEIIFA